jgi:hypothetical protein
VLAFDAGNRDVKDVLGPERFHHVWASRGTPVLTLLFADALTVNTIS